MLFFAFLYLFNILRFLSLVFIRKTYIAFLLLLKLSFVIVVFAINVDYCLFVYNLVNIYIYYIVPLTLVLSAKKPHTYNFLPQ